MQNQNYSKSIKKSQQQILFISQGKLRQVSTNRINGEIWIMDEDNLTDIIGYFKQGQCKNACVYSMHQNTISNIAIKINQSKLVLIGGNEVEQTKLEILLYKGGYRGYKRYGFGTIYYNQQGNDYEQWGFWNGLKQRGKFIKQNYAQQSQYSIIQYEPSSTWKQVKFINTSNTITKMQIDSQNEYSSSSKFITKEEYKNEIQSIQLYKQQLLDKHNQQNFIQPIKLYPITYNKYNNKQLEYIQKLTHDQCEFYLQYLFHQKENHQFKKTAIISLYVIDIQYKMSKHPLTNYKYNNEINRLMSKYHNQFSLFLGFWDRIIIPLVLTEVNDHYTFAVINLTQMKCIYYDSLHSADTKLYNRLIRQFLLKQANKCNGQYYGKLIENIEFLNSKEMPFQYDFVSCGYFMIWGITQILKNGIIKFSNKELPFVKHKIIAKLKEINR